MSFDIREWAVANMNAKASGTKELLARCPWCEKDGTFYLNGETGAYICFKCEHKGKQVTSLIAKVEGISAARARSKVVRVEFDFPRRRSSLSIRDRLAELRGRELEDEPDQGQRAELPPEFVPVWNGERKRWRFPSYLKERGLTRRTAARFDLGYCDRGRYADRVVCPIVCPGGESFTARAIGPAKVKYLNPPGARHGRLVYGWKQAKIGADFVLVEGPFDVLNCAQKGFNALGILGKALHSDQLKILSSWPKGAAVTLLLDPEAEPEAFKIAARLHGIIDGVFVGRLPLGRDPGDSTKEELAEAIDSADEFTGARVRSLRARLRAVQK